MLVTLRGERVLKEFLCLRENEEHTRERPDQTYCRVPDFSLVCAGLKSLVVWSTLYFRYTRQVIDETLRASVLAPWGARVHEYDLQVGEFVIPKEVNPLQFTV